MKREINVKNNQDVMEERWKEKIQSKAKEIM